MGLSRKRRARETMKRPINNKHIIFDRFYITFCLDLHLLLSLNFLALHLLALFSFFFLVFCFLNFLLIYGICCYGSNIPDICQFWDTTALFSPVKVHQKVRKFAICVICAKQGTDLKKYTTIGCGGCDKYQLWVANR